MRRCWSLFILDFWFDVVDSVRGLYLKGDGFTRQSLDEDLHYSISIVQKSKGDDERMEMQSTRRDGRLTFDDDYFKVQVLSVSTRFEWWLWLLFTTFQGRVISWNWNFGSGLNLETVRTPTPKKEFSRSFIA